MREAFKRSYRFLNDDFPDPLHCREWIRPTPAQFAAWASEVEVFAFDSELDPQVLAFADGEKVLSFVFSEAYRPAVERLMRGPALKLAHNFAHDQVFFRKFLDIHIKMPWQDTMGLAHLADPELEKALSPSCAVRYTSWAYHKWMSGVDPLMYCGMDAACCFDVFKGWHKQRPERAVEALTADGAPTTFVVPDELVDFDHRTFEALLEMTENGVRIDVDQREEAERDLQTGYDTATEEFQRAAAPIVAAKLKYFKKPHLFEVEKRCSCCNGGRVAREHCWRCGGLEKAVTGKRRDALPECRVCEGKGRLKKAVPVNPASGDQIQDLFYRGLGIRPRMYMGKVTTRYERLEPIADRHPLIADYVALSKIKGKLGTVSRLKPDVDGRLHCIFTPFVTTSGRVASREGLMEVGTNLMNVPKEARRMIVADPGHFLLYPDMAQIEARCVAILAKEQKLIDIYAAGGDSHTATMRLIEDRTGISFDALAKKDGISRLESGRQIVKTATYAFMYGIRAPHLSGELGLPVKEGQQILDVYELTFPKIAAWQREVGLEVYQTRRVSTPGLHSRRFLDRIVTGQQLGMGQIDYEILKKALSHKPQDMAAHILALGLLDIVDNHAGLLQPLAHVHDALLLQAKLENRREAVEAALGALTRDKWGLNFPADMSVGPDWYIASLGDAKKPPEWRLENFLGE
jgi:DNA polymerase I-like protein with 3'-5' exonuclease and polymerase domains